VQLSLFNIAKEKINKRRIKLILSGINSYLGILKHYKPEKNQLAKSFRLGKFEMPTGTNQQSFATFRISGIWYTY